MSGTTRRIVLWALTAAVLTTAVAALGWLPGASGPVDELRWLLRRAEQHPQLLNHASLLILRADKKAPGRGQEIFRALLADDDRRVVRGALVVLADYLKSGGAASKGLAPVFSEWFGRRSLEDKIAFLPHSLICRAWTLGPPPELGCYSPSNTSLVANWATVQTDDDVRWLVAATLQRDPQARELVQSLLFAAEEEKRGIVHWLDYVDGLAAFKPPDTERPGSLLEAVSAPALREQMRLDPDQLTEMLSDPIKEVGWGAARILAVGGDVRALPAFCQWLGANPRRGPQAQALMTDLFGPDWRKLCESGAATRPACQGDG